MENFWKDKKVVVTGHTGFKGSWLSEWLLNLGANVSGFSLPPDTHQTLFDGLSLGKRMNSEFGDIRNSEALVDHFRNFTPDVIFHMAASPLVLSSYEDPLTTWSTNVTGSLNVLEALRAVEERCVAVMVTTDKVYKNQEWAFAYREDDKLGGHDPYSSSKAAMELAVSSWRDSFFSDQLISLVTARAGNVIGGGDWSENRIVPDVVRSLIESRPACIRNPNAMRPFQHVLEPLSGYLRLAEELYEGRMALEPSYNFGPSAGDTLTVSELVECIFESWPGTYNYDSPAQALHEASRLSLSIDLAASDLGYRPRWGAREGIKRTVEWYKSVYDGTSSQIDVTQRQIMDFGRP